MKELQAKFKKMSSLQLFAKLEKGKITEVEKKLIISELVRRGKDVTFYTNPEVFAQDEEVPTLKEFSPKPIKKSSELAKEKKETKEKISTKTAKPNSLSNVSSKASTKYIDEKFYVGAKVEVLNDSRKIPSGTLAYIKQCYFITELPEWKWAILRSESGEYFERNLSKLKVLPKS